MKNILMVILTAVIVLSGMKSYASEEGKFAFSLKAGTLGGGVEGIARLNPRFNAKAAFNYFEYDYDSTKDDIDYDLDIELLTAGILLDWFMFGNSFRMTGGFFSNDNQVDLSARSAASYEIGGVTFTSAQVGNLTGELEFDPVASYAGIGWGNPFGGNKRWSFNFDIGVLFQGKPEVNLIADGTLAGDPVLQSNLRTEEQNLEDDLEDFEYYPVVSIGVSYKF
jgi:hypothetical protein